MRQITWWIGMGLALTALGCGGGGNNAPVSPSLPAVQLPIEQTPAPAGVTSVPAALGATYQRGADVLESAVALYTLDIDPVNLSATARLKANREAQATDDLYLLPLNGFFTPNSFKVVSIDRQADTLDVTYDLAHPFPAPSNLDGPIHAKTNRADLAVTGMVLFLTDVADVNGNTFFTDRYVNTSVVENADAYYSPGGLFTLGGLANTFPYKLMVDETVGGVGSRVGISNEGDVTGNFGPDGWTRDEMGPNRNGWTGYGVLHQGQTSRNTVSFNLFELGAGVSLDIAVVARYQDPRGGTNAAQKKANRLPPMTPDAALFAYRLPHEALDVQKIDFLDAIGEFVQDETSAATLRFHVEDWDARADVTGASDLSLDPLFNTVASGEEGTPTLSVCIPGVLGDPTAVVDLINAANPNDLSYGGDTELDLGMPGDALYYSETVTKAPVGGQTPDSYVGMVRVTDPETLIADPNYVIEVDKNLQQVLDIPMPVTYQRFNVDMVANNHAPEATVVLVSSPTLLSGSMPSVLVTGMSDEENDNLDITMDWGDGMGFVNLALGHVAPYAPLNPTGPQMNNLDLVADLISMTVRITDGQLVVDYPLSYTLGANRAPILSGTPALTTASLPILPAPAFSLNDNGGTATFTDPEGNPITLRVRNTANGSEPTGAAFPISGHSSPINSVGTVDFTVYVEDALHQNPALAQPNSAARFSAVTGTVTRLPGWIYKGSAQSTGIEQGLAIARDSQNNIYYAGYYQLATNQFMPAVPQPLVGVTPDLFLVKLNPFGVPQWVRPIGATTSGATGLEQLGGIAVDSNDNPLVYVAWRGLLNIDGSTTELSDNTVANLSTDLCLIKYDKNTGLHLSHWRTQTTGDANVSECFGFNGLVADNLGSAYITGRFNRFEDFPTGAAPFTLTTAHGPASANYDPFVARIDTSSMQTIWATNFAMSSNAGTSATGVESGQSVCLTPFNQLIVGGYFRGMATVVVPASSDFGGGPRLIRLNSTTHAMGFITMRDISNGSWIWDRVFGSTLATVAHVNGVSAGPLRVYATGRYGQNTNFNGVTDVAASNVAVANYDPYIAAYNISDGTFAWVNAMTRTSGLSAVNSGYSVLYANNSVYATGDFNTTQDLGSGGTVSAGTSGYVVKRVAASGANALKPDLSPYIMTWDGSLNDKVRGLTLDTHGDVFIAGEWAGTGMDADPGAGTSIHASLSNSIDHFAVKFLDGTASF